MSFHAFSDPITSTSVPISELTAVERTRVLLLVVCFLSFDRSCIFCGSNPSIVVTTVFVGFTVSRFQKIPFLAWNGRGCFRLPGRIPSPVGNRSRAFGIDIYYYLRATPLRRSLSKRTRNVAVEIVRPQKSSC